MIEIIMVVAVLGILLAIAIPNLRPPSVQLAANATQAFAQQARFEAIKRNEAVVVRIDASGTTLVMHTAAAGAGCNPGTEIRNLPLADFARVQGTSATSGFPFVFRWLPTGQPQSCAPGGGPLPLSGLSLALSDGGRRALVSVSTGGEVSVQ